MFQNIQVENAFRWAGFKVIVEGRNFYFNRTNIKKFVWTKEIPSKQEIKDKVESSLSDFYTFFHETQRIK